MLQITSGRFWGEVDRYELQTTTLLYSVLKIDQKTTTLIGTFVPIKVEHPEIQSTEFTYQHGLPLPSNGITSGVMVGTSGSEIREQMIDLLIVCTGRLWTQEAESITNLIEKNKQSEALFPYFTTIDDIGLGAEQLSQFIHQAISLPRDHYRKAVVAAAALNQIIQASDISYDAAFAMAIFAIESLVPEKAVPDWSYIPNQLREDIDKVLTPVTEEISDQIRKALLKDRHFKLQANFIKFVEERINGSFYRSSIGIKRLDLHRVLSNAYSGRSQYAHKLTAVERPMFGIHRNQSITWQFGEPHLTLQGASLLLCEVIRGYIQFGPHLDSEDGVDWKKQLPGVIHNVPIAPEYWLWSPKLFEHNDLRNLLCHVVQHAARLMIGAKETRIDLRQGLETGMARFDQMPKRDRLCFVCMVLIWVWIAPNEKPNGCDKFLDKHQNNLDHPSPESLMIYALGGFPIPWSIEDTERQWQKYKNERYGLKKLNFIHPVEAAMQGVIANMLFDSSEVSSYKTYCNSIADNEGDRPHIIDHIKECISQQKQLSIPLLLGASLSTDEAKS
jgi:hypothetical protein